MSGPDFTFPDLPAPDFSLGDRPSGLGFTAIPFIDLSTEVQQYGIAIGIAHTLEVPPLNLTD